MIDNMKSPSIFDDYSKHIVSDDLYAKLAPKALSNVYQTIKESDGVDSNDELVVKVLMRQVSMIKQHSQSFDASSKYMMVQKYTTSENLVVYTPHSYPDESAEPSNLIIGMTDNFLTPQDYDDKNRENRIETYSIGDSLFNAINDERLSQGSFYDDDQMWEFKFKDSRELFSQDSMKLSKKFSTSIEQDSIAEQPTTKEPCSKLALRPDVMNKNIIRAIKREGKTLFQNFLKSSNIKIQRKKLRSLAIFRNFAEHILNRFDPEWQSWSDFNIEDFSIYLGGLSNYCMMKKLTPKTQHTDKMDTIYDILYKYSHIKFDSFIKTREVSVIFNVIGSGSKANNLINNNDSLAEHKSNYNYHIQNLLFSIKM